jgi:hypothetical protein
LLSSVNEKIDPHPFASRVLVADEHQRASCPQQRVGHFRAAVRGDDHLPHRLAKAVHQPVQVRVVEGAGDRERRKAPEAGDVAAYLKIAKVGGDDHLWPRLEELAHQLPLAVHSHELPPVGLVDLARGVGNLARHQQQMLPHLAGQSAAIGFGRFGKGDLQVVVDELVPQADHVAHQPGQEAANRVAGFDSDCQDQRHRNPNRQVFGPVAERGERHSLSSNERPCGLPDQDCPFCQAIADGPRAIRFGVRRVLATLGERF